MVILASRQLVDVDEIAIPRRTTQTVADLGQTTDARLSREWQGVVTAVSGEVKGER
jgi:hypothetical protein